MSKKRCWALFGLIATVTLAGIIWNAERYTLIAAHVGMFPAVAYPLLYRSAPWKKTATGRALMNHARANALLFTVPIVGYWWPFPGFPQIYAVVVTYLVWSIGYQFLVMNRLRRQGQAKHVARPAPAREGAES